MLRLVYHSHLTLCRPMFILNTIDVIVLPEVEEFTPNVLLPGNK